MKNSLYLEKKINFNYAYERTQIIKFLTSRMKQKITYNSTAKEYFVSITNLEFIFLNIQFNSK